jgi:NADH-quinone oxidoreductase subunit M
MLPMVQKIWFNRLENPDNLKLADLSGRELVVLLPLVIGMLWMGFYPKPFLDRANVSLTELVATVEQRSAPVLPPLGLQLEGTGAAAPVEGD